MLEIMTRRVALEVRRSLDVMDVQGCFSMLPHLIQAVTSSPLQTSDSRQSARVTQPDRRETFHGEHIDLPALRLADLSLETSWPDDLARKLPLRFMEPKTTHSLPLTSNEAQTRASFGHVGVVLGLMILPLTAAIHQVPCLVSQEFTLPSPHSVPWELESTVGKVKAFFTRSFQCSSPFRFAMVFWLGYSVQSLRSNYIGRPRWRWT